MTAYDIFFLFFSFQLSSQCMKNQTKIEIICWQFAHIKVFVATSFVKYFAAFYSNKWNFPKIFLEQNPFTWVWKFENYQEKKLKLWRKAFIYIEDKNGFPNFVFVFNIIWGAIIYCRLLFEIFFNTMKNGHNARESENTS